MTQPQRPVLDGHGRPVDGVGHVLIGPNTPATAGLAKEIATQVLAQLGPPLASEVAAQVLNRSLPDLLGLLEARYGLAPTEGHPAVPPWRGEVGTPPGEPTEETGAPAPEALP